MAEHTPFSNQLVPPRHSPVTSADDQENRSNAARPGGHERTGNDESPADPDGPATRRRGGWNAVHPAERTSHSSRHPPHPRRQAAARDSASRVRGGDVPDAGGLRPAVGRQRCEPEIEHQFQLPGFPAGTNSGSGFGRQGCGARLAHQGCGKSFGTAECRVSVRQLACSHAGKRSATQRELTLDSNPPPTRVGAHNVRGVQLSEGNGWTPRRTTGEPRSTRPAVFQGFRIRRTSGPCRFVAGGTSGQLHYTIRVVSRIKRAICLH